MITSWLEKTFRRKTASLNYIPVVDGIRFLAITLVFLFHAAQYFEKQWGIPTRIPFVWQTLLDNGHKGVPVFFMLSGFIVSLPFAKYYLADGKKILLKDYFLRRLIRLEPPYIIAMTLFFCIAVVQHPDQLKHLAGSLLASFVYLHTIIFHHFPYINQVAWSLEIEVQFYIVAPLIFLIFKLPYKPRRLILLIATVLSSLYPLVIKPIFILPEYLQYFLPGILLADIYVTGIPGILNKKWVVPVAAFIFCYMIWLPLYHHRYTMPMFPLSMYTFLLMVFGNDILKKIFSLKLITLIGGMCYSIYLIHGLLIIYIDEWAFQFRVPGSYMMNFAIQSIIYAIATLIVCSIYFVLVEKPFMGLSFRNKKSISSSE